MGICLCILRNQKEGYKSDGIVSRIKREVFIRPWLKQGYSRKLANAYYKKVQWDNKLDNGISMQDKKWAHDHKYLSTSIEKYDLKNNLDKYISDVDYLFLQPFNNSFTKWMKDLCHYKSCAGQLSRAPAEAVLQYH